MRLLKNARRRLLAGAASLLGFACIAGAAQQVINVGAAPNDGTGDPARTAFQKVNANFADLYSTQYAPIGVGNFTGFPAKTALCNPSTVSTAAPVYCSVTQLLQTLGPLTGDVTTSSGTQATVISQGAVSDDKGSLSNKPALKVVATTNQALTGLTATIDGQVIVAGDAILLAGQTTASQNGPWVTQSGAWTRPTWYPSTGTTQAVQFSTALIRLGATYQGSTWRLTTAPPITIDATAETWVVTPIALNTSTTTGGGGLIGSLIPSAATFTASGCSNSTLVGGANTTALVAAGSFNSGVSGACTVVMTFPAATHGWACEANDVSSPVVFQQTAKSTTSCTVSASTASGDTVTFMAIGY
jgi:hypothetical protein